MIEKLRGHRDYTFFLKKIKESDNGKSVLIGFEVKGTKRMLWIPKKAIYRLIENDLPDLSKEYKKMIIPSFIFNDKRKLFFFKTYFQLIDPIIDRLEKKKKELKNDKILKEFKTRMKNVIPNVDIIKANSKEIETSIGNFRISSLKPLTFRINDISLTLNNNSIDLTYKDLFIRGLGKFGAITKALIKHNTGQKLNAIEKISLRKIYIHFLFRHDWHYQMSDDMRVYRNGQYQSNVIESLIDIFKSIGEESFAISTYKKYSK